MKLKLRYLLQPVILLLFPIAFIYNRNFQRVNPQDILLPLGISLCVGAITFAVLFLIIKKLNALFCLVSSVTLLNFGTYGAVYEALKGQPLLTIDHYNLLPLLLVISGYIIWFFRRTNDQTRKNFADIILLVSSGLLLVNLVPSIIGEVSNSVSNDPYQETSQEVTSSRSNTYPDIYYIILDEYSSFSTIKQYFEYDNTAFEQYLIDKGFFVAENSKGLSPVTRVEIASRLNFHSYLEYQDEWNYLHGEIGNNKTVQILKELGYTTIVMDTANINANQFADVTFAVDSENVSLGLSEFATIYIQSSLLNPIWDKWTKNVNPGDMAIRQSVVSAVNHFLNLNDYPTPVFVYIHLNLPHPPFVFDEDGYMVPSQHRIDFNYYLGQYKYATKVATEMVESVLSRANSENPPIIILQSDHGVRPYVSDASTETVANFIVKDYPESEKVKILNALYLPGIDYTTLADDIDPLSIFPMIFDKYFSIQVDYP